MLLFLLLSLTAREVPAVAAQLEDGGEGSLSVIALLVLAGGVKDKSLSSPTPCSFMFEEEEW